MFVVLVKPTDILYKYININTSTNSITNTTNTITINNNTIKKT
jgi:hypothetical protein